MPTLAEHEVFQVVGEEGFEQLCRAFYRQIPGDELLGPMYPADDLAGAEQRLRDFLVYRFGGPQRYLEHRGHPRLRMRHAPFAIDAAARERWMELMVKSLDETQLNAEATAVLLHFFEQMSLFLINRDA